MEKRSQTAQHQGQIFFFLIFLLLFSCPQPAFAANGQGPPYGPDDLIEVGTLGPFLLALQVEAKLRVQAGPAVTSLGSKVTWSLETGPALSRLADTGLGGEGDSGSQCYLSRVSRPWSFLSAPCRRLHTMRTQDSLEAMDTAKPLMHMAIALLINPTHPLLLPTPWTVITQVLPAPSRVLHLFEPQPTKERNSTVAACGLALGTARVGVEATNLLA